MSSFSVGYDVTNFCSLLRREDPRVLLARRMLSVLPQAHSWAVTLAECTGTITKAPIWDPLKLTFLFCSCTRTLLKLACSLRRVFLRGTSASDAVNSTRPLQDRR
jgi:hypothetical protein